MVFVHLSTLLILSLSTLFSLFTLHLSANIVHHSIFLLFTLPMHHFELPSESPLHLSALFIYCPTTPCSIYLPSLFAALPVPVLFICPFFTGLRVRVPLICPLCLLAYESPIHLSAIYVFWPPSSALFVYCPTYESLFHLSAIFVHCPPSPCSIYLYILYLFLCSFFEQS